MPPVRTQPSDSTSRSRASASPTWSSEKEAGGLSDEEFAQARQDLELALAQDLEGTAETKRQPHGSGGRWALLAAAILIPLITIPVLPADRLTTADRRHARAPPRSPPVTAQRRDAAGRVSWSNSCATRMEANPDNAEGWFLLGRTYMRLQNYTQAVYAFEHVVGLLPDETAGLLSLADAMTMRERPPRRRARHRIAGKGTAASTLTASPHSGCWAMPHPTGATMPPHWVSGSAPIRCWTGEPAMQNELGQMISQAGRETAAPPAALPPIMAAAPQAAVAAPAAAPAAAPPSRSTPKVPPSWSRWPWRPR